MFACAALWDDSSCGSCVLAGLSLGWRLPEQLQLRACMEAMVGCSSCPSPGLLSRCLTHNLTPLD